MTATINANNTTARIGAWASGIGAVLFVFGGVIAFLTHNAATDNQVGQDTAKILALEAQVAKNTSMLGAIDNQVTQNAAKIGALERQYSLVVDRLGEIRNSQTKQSTALTEIETQFCGEDIVRNLMHANDLRLLSMLWHKTFDQEIPISNSYYPTICNRAGVSDR